MTNLSPLDLALAAEDYESRVARGETKTDAMYAVLTGLQKLAVIRRRVAVTSIGSVPAWARPVMLEVCREYRVSVEKLIGPRRHRPIVKVRNELAARLRQLIGPDGKPRSFPEIGQAIGGRDHSTIIHAIGRHEELREARAA